MVRSYNLSTVKAITISIMPLCMLGYYSGMIFRRNYTTHFVACSVWHAMAVTCAQESPQSVILHPCFVILQNSIAWTSDWCLLSGVVVMQHPCK